MSDSLTYWASEGPDVLAKRAMDKVRAYRRWFYATGYATKALKGWRYTNGWTDAGETSSRLQLGGETGELVKAVVNGVRPLRQRTVAMILSGAPEMRPIASNSDAQAREQADLSKGVLEHVHRTHKRGKRDRQVLNLALDMGESALVVEWDQRAGRPVAPDPATGGIALWEGDISYWVASAFDLYREVGLRDWEEASWVIVRRWVSKYRLAAIYPEKAREIVSLQSGYRVEDQYDYFDLRMAREIGAETDVVPLYTLWHLDSPELEGGLEFRFLNNGTWLDKGPYPYTNPDGPSLLPVQRLAPDDVACTSLGYTTMFDALGISDALNAIASAMVTNVSKGAVPPLLNPKNSGLSLGAPIGTGHKVLNVNSHEQAPKFMETPSTPPEAYKLAEVLERWRLESFGLNETAMGRPPYSGMAAQAMALLDSKADEYQDSLRKGYLDYLAGAATFELHLLKTYAREERVAQIAGKAKQWMARTYTGADLESVDAIHVEPVGQASRTLAGKLGMLETFANFGVQLSPEQIVELTQTGQYEADFEAPLANRLRIREENEMLMRGEMPEVLDARTHWLDIPEHLALLSSPATNQRPEVVNAVLSTVQAKLEAWRNMPSDLLALLGGQPPPPPGIPAVMAGMMGAGVPSEGSEAPAPEGEPAPGAAGDAQAALAPDAEPTNLPLPPQEAA